ncbi:GDP-mannose 4,6-dehydratase [Porticoccaceae bacterium]|nr:GDP-mannose 4,6-dehydratase [Porticoccaceae bacterium]
MKLLVTGADGFTGQHLCSRAAKAGYEVVKLKADLLDREALQDEVLYVQPDLVVHLAAISFVGSPDKISFYAVNVIGTTNLLDAILKLPKAPFKVLLASSANVYGNCEISSIGENVVPNPINHYAASKLAMEKMALTYSDKISVVITRPFNYTGPGQDINFVIPKLVDHFLNKKSSISLGNIDVEREFNNVEMVCESYLELLNHGMPGEIYNVCSGAAYSLQFVIDMLTKLTGHSIKVHIDPKFVRKHEVSVLKGDPGKLNHLLRQDSETLARQSIESTLLAMLNECL